MKFYVNLTLIPVFNAGINLYDELARLGALTENDGFRFDENNAKIEIELTVEQARLLVHFKSLNYVNFSINSVNITADDCVNYIGYRGGLALNNDVCDAVWLIEKIKIGAIKDENGLSVRLIEGDII